MCDEVVGLVDIHGVGVPEVDPLISMSDGENKIPDFFSIEF